MTGHNNTTESINTKYLRLLKSVEELKRLQKEIDESEEEMNTITQSSWGLDKPENLNRHFELTDFKESNQAKIKQIIEEL